MTKLARAISAAAMAVVMTTTMAATSLAANDISVCSTCGHTTQVGSIEGPYQYSFLGTHTLTDGRICTVTQKIGFIVERCTKCGTVVSKNSTTIGGEIHSINHP
ncbi:unknown [Eubacterium sp. CAG:786]|nr:unknown [Eubacterium sp. CAG:786]